MNKLLSVEIYYHISWNKETNTKNFPKTFFYINKTSKESLFHYFPSSNSLKTSFYFPYLLKRIFLLSNQFWTVLTLRFNYWAIEWTVAFPLSIKFIASIFSSIVAFFFLLPFELLSFYIYYFSSVITSFYVSSNLSSILFNLSSISVIFSFVISCIFSKIVVK